MIGLNYTAQFPWEAKEEFEVGVSRVLYWIGCISSNGSSAVVYFVIHKLVKE